MVFHEHFYVCVFVYVILTMLHGKQCVFLDETIELIPMIGTLLFTGGPWKDELITRHEGHDGGIILFTHDVSFISRCSYTSDFKRFNSFEYILEALNPISNMTPTLTVRQATIVSEPRYPRKFEKYSEKRKLKMIQIRFYFWAIVPVLLATIMVIMYSPKK